MREEETAQLDLNQINSNATISLSFNTMPQSTNASSTSHLSTGTNSTPFVLSTTNAAESSTDNKTAQMEEDDAPFMKLEPPVSLPEPSLPQAETEEEKKTMIGNHTQITKQDSVLSTGGGVALTGRNKLSLGFYNLNSDFALPPDFKLVKKLGRGAYGQVMQILHMPSQREYACKRYEHVYSDTQRSRRLLREMSIL